MRQPLFTVILAITLAGCAGGQAADDAATTPPAATPAAPPAVSPGPTPPGHAPDAATETAADATDAPPAAVAEMSTEPQGTPEFPDSGMDAPTYLTDVRIGRHPGFDRVVWVFDGELPAYRAQYIERPVTEDGSGEPIEVRGDAALQIIFTLASGTELVGEEPRAIYLGPDRIDGADAGALAVQEVVETGDFEATLSWAVGVDRQAPFTVTELSGPSRVVIDVASG